MILQSAGEVLKRNWSDAISEMNSAKVVLSHFKLNTRF